MKQWLKTNLKKNGREAPRPGGPADGGILLKQVVKNFATPAGVFSALRGVDLAIRQGEFAAIVGKSGSGKSTLLNMITGIDHPTSGEVYVQERALHRMSEAQLTAWRGEAVGIVFQFFQLIPTLTVLENVIMPMDFCGKFSLAERRKRALSLLEQVGLSEMIHKLPATISGGQQQRAAIARALANDPPIVVADEPTGNLDSASAEVIFNLFKQLTGLGKTILIVTHDHDIASSTGRVIYLADGRVVESAAFPGANQPEQPLHANTINELTG